MNCYRNSYPSIVLSQKCGHHGKKPNSKVADMTQKGSISPEIKKSATRHRFPQLTKIGGGDY